MRIRILAIAVFALLPIGCATGFRLGGDRCGIGLGGYIGPVPEAARLDRGYYPPPVDLPPPAIPDIRPPG